MSDGSDNCSNAMTRHSRGFTLLELLVVLVIVGMSGSFVGPNLWKKYVKSSERGVLQNVAVGLHGLQHKAFSTGKELYVMRGGKFIKQYLPKGWEVLKMKDIYFLPSGVTNGGNVYLRSPSGFKWLLILSALDGEAKISRL